MQRGIRLYTRESAYVKKPRLGWPNAVSIFGRRQQFTRFADLQRIYITRRGRMKRYAMPDE